MIVASGKLNHQPTLNERMVVTVAILLDQVIASEEPIDAYELADRIVGELTEIQASDEYEHECKERISKHTPD